MINTRSLFKWIVCYLALTCLVHAEVLDTWIIAGQSNAEGYAITDNPVPGLAPASTLSSIGRSVLNATHPNIQMFQGANEYNGITSSAGLSLPAKDAWHSMNAQEGMAYDWGSGRGGESGRRFGPELSFGYDVQAKMGTRIALIKYARGSASIAPSTTQGGGIWLDFDPSDGGRLNHYDKLITTIQTAVNNLPAGQVLNVRGVIWMQGEGDATAAFAPAYQANLTEFITTLRNDIGTIATASGGKMTGAAATWGQLDVFLGTIQNSSTNHQTVINAQNAVAAADANVHTVNATTGLSLMTVDDWGYGGLHYDTAGQVLLGERFADAALKEVVAADSFGNGTVKIPTTASGGTGTVANLQTDNDVNYTVAKSATATIGGFGTHGSAISSVYLFVQYSVETGYTGSNAIKVNGVNTPIVPAARDYGRWAYVDITAGSFGVDTSAEISNLSVTFLNNHGGTGKSVFLDCVYVVVNPQTAIPTPPTWVEDFNGTGQANPMVWNYEVGYQRNNEAQYYVAGAANGWQEGGNFIIEGRKESTYPGYAYTSASIITSGKYYWKFGRAQIRAKIPAKPGMWPAIWGTGEVGNWPHNGEVDIMEYYGEKILGNVAVGTATAWNAKWDGANRTLPSLLTVDPNWRDAWHIWTMQWDDQYVRLYVDNILVNTISQTWMVNTAGYDPSWGPQYPFQSNGMNCWLNLAMGGNAGGDPTATMNSGPQRYLIDYWKIWEGATNNVAPTNIALSANSVSEGVAAGTVVGTLSATDADPAEVHRYTLVTGTGSTHNAQFAIPEFISGNTLQGVLKTTAVLNYADGATRSIRVRVTDIEGLTYDKILTINIQQGITYPITYHANGATSGTLPANQTKTSGVNLTLASNSGALAKTGYTFAGWNTDPNGTGTDFAAGGTYTSNASVTLYAKWTTFSPVVTLFADDFNSANGTSLTDPASRATGTLASTVKYALSSTTGMVVNGMLSWDANNSRDANHEQTDATGTQNLSITHNWAPQVAGKIWEVEFKQRVGWSHPLTFGLSDNAQTGQWDAWDSANYDFAIGSYGTSLRYDFDNQSGSNLANLASIFPSPPNTTDTHHIRIRFDEPAGITTVWINGIVRVQTTGLDFENSGRYLTWGEPGNYGGAIDDLVVRQLNDAQTIFDNWASGAAANADSNNDGVANSIAWLLGAANPSVNATALLPTFDNTTSADYFIYTYRRSDTAFNAPGIAIGVEYSSTLTLGSWTTAVHDGTNIIITSTNDTYGAGVDKVEVKIKKTLASGGKLFSRISLLTN